MSLDKETVLKVAKLARLRLDDDKVLPMTNELNNIMNWVAQLDKVDTDNVEPLYSVTQAQLPQRQDVAHEAQSQEDVLMNAPRKTQGFYTVPKVVE